MTDQRQQEALRDGDLMRAQTFTPGTPDADVPTIVNLAAVTGAPIPVDEPPPGRA
jgi:hypothetical protein